MQGRQTNDTTGAYSAPGSGGQADAPTHQAAGGFDYQSFQQSHDWQNLENWPASSDAPNSAGGAGDQGEFAPLESLVNQGYVGGNENEHLGGAGPSDWTTLGGAEEGGNEDSNGQVVGEDGYALQPGAAGEQEQSQEGDMTPSGGPTPRGKKLALACHFCRKRKLKCDGQQPLCENCRKRNQECVWDSYIRRRGPGRRTKEQRERSRRETDAAGLTLGDVSEGDIQATAEALAQVEGNGLGEHGQATTLADSLVHDQGGLLKRRKGEDGIGVGVGVGLGGGSGNGGYGLHGHHQHTHHHHLGGPEDLTDLTDASFDGDLEGLEALQSLDSLHAIRELTAQDIGAVVGQAIEQEQQRQGAGVTDDDPTIDPALKG